MKMPKIKKRAAYASVGFAALTALGAAFYTWVALYGPPA